MRSAVLGLLAIGLFSATPAANAIPIPVGGGVPGTGLIINFDFSGQIPSPPYGSVTGTINFSGFGPGESVIYDWFDGLNATGVAISSNAGFGGSDTFGFFSNSPTLTDGLFSFVFRAQPNTTVEYVSFSATGSTPGSPDAVISDATVTVPEPGTLLLLSGGLLGLGLIGRRRSTNV